MLPLRTRLSRSVALVVSTGLLLGCGEPVATRGQRPSVVLVTLDTTRVDHLSCYGYARNTTPHLDALRERAVLHRRAWSTSSWTLPAHASLFTGLHPSRHGAHYLDRGPAALGEVLDIPIAEHVRAARLPDERDTLAELLRQAGHRTAAFVAGPWLNRSFGLLQGFEVKDDAVSEFAGRPAEAVTNAALEWLRMLKPDEPYFLFVNYFDPHAPYDPKRRHADLPRAHEPFEPDWDGLMRGQASLSEDERAVLIDRYDAEIREMDVQLGRLLDSVLERAAQQPTLVIVTADHGEALGEGGRVGHGFWLTEELIRIPLIVRFPDERGAGTSSDAPIQLVDVLPLVAAEVGIALPDTPGLPGPGVPRELAIAELYREATTVVRYGERYDRDFQVAIEWPYKLERVGEDGASLLRLDEGSLRETPDDSAPDVVRRLSAALQAHLASAPEQVVVRPEVSRETVEALRQLGYVE